MGQFSVEFAPYSDGQQWEVQAPLQSRPGKSDEIQGSITLGIRKLFKNWQEPPSRADPKAKSDGTQFYAVYQCQLCVDPVTASEKVWPCQQCFSVFHLTCATKAAKVVDKKGASWNCPWCASTVVGLPQASCYCGKSSKKAGLLTKGASLLSGRGLHSCGKTCERACPLPGCESTPHACEQACHFGPCGNLGEYLPCHCGREKKRLECGVSPIGSTEAFVCGTVDCGKKVEGCVKPACLLSMCILKCEEHVDNPCRCVCSLSKEEKKERQERSHKESKELLKSLGIK